MSYLNISSVSCSSCELPSPSARADANSDLPTSPVNTTVRVVISTGTACSRNASPLNSSSMGLSPIPGPASSRIARTLPSVGRLKLNTVPGRSLRSVGLIVGCCITRASWSYGIPNSSNTPLSVCPGLSVIDCQRSSVVLPARWPSLGSDNVIVMRCALGLLWVSSTVEKPGTIAASNIPIVVNTLACAQCRRVHRPRNGCAMDRLAGRSALTRARSKFSRRTAS